MFDIDSLIDEISIETELQQGVPAAWLVAQGANARMVTVLAQGTTQGKEAPWTEDEEQFVRDHYMTMTDAELGQALGRSHEAVHIRRERHLQLTARTQHPDWLTARRAAKAMGVKCMHQVVRWIDEGILPARHLPIEARDYWAIHRYDLTRFAVNPNNWIYFDPHTVQDPHIRRLVHLRIKRWNDEWWTVGQAAAYWGVTQSAINHRIGRGDLPAVRWGNWMIRRSHAQALRLIPGKGESNQYFTSPARDAFMLMARAVGHSYATIDMLAGGAKHSASRALYLHRKGNLPERLPAEVSYNPATGLLFAPWQSHTRRFPYLAHTMRRFAAGEPLTRDGRTVVAGVLWTWLAWHATTPEQQAQVERMTTWAYVTETTLRQTLAQLQQWGIDPTQEPTP